MSPQVNAVGVMFYSQSTDRYLYLLRNDVKHPDSWALAGGKLETGETLLGGLERECTEELGFMPAYIKLMPIEKFTSPDGHFAYNTFYCVVEDEFRPDLNGEHLGYAWLDSSVIPRPMHPGLYSTVNMEAVREKISMIQRNL